MDISKDFSTQLTYYCGLALTLFNPPRQVNTSTCTEHEASGYPRLPINPPYDRCHKFCLNNLGNKVSIEYLTLLKQHAFASCLLGTITEWTRSFLCILYLRFITAVDFTMLSPSVLKRTPNERLIFMFLPVTYMYHFGLHQRRFYVFWLLIKQSGILAAYKGSCCLPVTLATRTASSQYLHFTRQHPLYPSPSPPLY